MLVDLVLVCGSNKALEVYDMNVEKCVRVVPDVHSRPVHCISQSKVCPLILLHYKLNYSYYIGLYL